MLKNIKQQKINIFAYPIKNQPLKLQYRDLKTTSTRTVLSKCLVIQNKISKFES